MSAFLVYVRNHGSLTLEKLLSIITLQREAIKVKNNDLLRPASNNSKSLWWLGHFNYPKGCFHVLIKVSLGRRIVYILYLWSRKIILKHKTIRNWLDRWNMHVHNPMATLWLRFLCCTSWLQIHTNLLSKLIISCAIIRLYTSESLWRIIGQYKYSPWWIIW